MKITRLVTLFLVLHLFLCAVQTQTVETDAADPAFNSESFNTKWVAIKSWMNSTKLVATGSIVFPRIKMLCTNKFIDLIVVMCKQYSSHEAAQWQDDDSISTPDGHADESHRDTQAHRLRHARHWNATHSALTTKRLRSLLRRMLPATVIHRCCSESCNVSSLLSYCPVEQRPQPIYVRSGNNVIGTITLAHGHNQRHPPHYNWGASSGYFNATQLDTLARLTRNYEAWKAQAAAKAAAANSGTSTSTFNYESSQSDEYGPNESSGGRGLGRNAREHSHQSTEAPPTSSSTMPTRHHSFIDTYNNTPEPFTFDLRSTDILYRP